jgi:beta-lactamase regulating signal transducer with metallopeptidase domain
MASNPLQFMFSDGVTYALGWTLVHSLWQASAVAVLVGVVMVLLRRQTARLRYAVLASAMLLLLCMGVGTFVMAYRHHTAQQDHAALLVEFAAEQAQLLQPANPENNSGKPQLHTHTPNNLRSVLAELGTLAMPATTTTPTAKTPTAKDNTTNERLNALKTEMRERLQAQLAAMQRSLQASVWSSLYVGLQSAFERFAPALSGYASRHLPLLVTFWLLGVVVLTLKLLGGLAVAQRLKHYRTSPVERAWQERLNRLGERLGLPMHRRRIVLVESRVATTPMVIGIVRHTILLPLGMIAAMPTDYVESILAHELAHIARRDYLVNIVQSCVEALFFFHPAVWWMSALLRAEREHCCDDLAVQACGDPLALANALVALNEQRLLPYGLPSTPSVAMAARGTGKRSNEFTNRIRRLLGGGRERTVSLGTVAACLLLTAASLTAGMMLRPVVQPVLAETWTDAAEKALQAVKRPFGGSSGSAETPRNAAPQDSAELVRDQARLNSQMQAAANTFTGEGRWFALFRQNNVVFMMQHSPIDEFWDDHNGVVDNVWMTYAAEAAGLWSSSNNGGMMYSSRHLSREAYSRFEGLDASKARSGGALKFTLTRQQGVFTFTGESRGGKAKGSYTFKPNAAYLAQLKQWGYTTAQESDMERLAFAEVSLEKLKALGGLGYSVQETTAFIQRGIGVEYIKVAKEAGFTPEEIQELGVRGIKPEYVKQMKQAGFSMDDIEELGVRGIAPEAALAFKQAGFDTGDIADLGVRGIKPDYVKAMKEAGFTSEDIQEIGARGISVETAVAYKKAGFSADDIADLAVRGIKPDYVKAMKEAGFSRNDIEDFGARGIKLETAMAYKKAGFSADDIADLAVRGISAETAAAFKQAGFTADETADVAVRGIKPDFVREMKAAGFRFEDILDIGVRGISAARAKELKQQGFSSDEIADLGVSGLSMEFVRSMKAFGFATGDIKKLGWRGVRLSSVEKLKKEGLSNKKIVEVLTD